MSIDNLDRHQNGDDGDGDDDDGYDLSLFAEALELANDGSPESELEALRRISKELAEEYGIETSIYSGRDLGSVMSLNNRLDVFSSSVGEVSFEIAQAIQNNQFTRELATKMLNEIMDENALFIQSIDKLESIRNAAYQMIEILLYLGTSGSGNDDPIVEEQRNMMISNIKSYDIMLSTFTTYLVYINDYINRRSSDDTKIVKLADELLPRLYSEVPDSDSDILNYQNVRSEVNRVVKDAIANKGNPELNIGELRQILIAYRDAIGVDLEGKDRIAYVDHEALNKCTAYIEKI